MTKLDLRKEFIEGFERHLRLMDYQYCSSSLNVHVDDLIDNLAMNFKFSSIERINILPRVSRGKIIANCYECEYDIYFEFKNDYTCRLYDFMLLPLDVYGDEVL